MSIGIFHENKFKDLSSWGYEPLGDEASLIGRGAWRMWVL